MEETLKGGSDGDKRKEAIRRLEKLMTAAWIWDEIRGSAFAHAAQPTGGASPAAVTTLMRMNSQIDISNILPAVRVPTLVIHRTGDRVVDIAGGRDAAAHIPGAGLLELPGVGIVRLLVEEARHALPPPTNAQRERDDRPVRPSSAGGALPRSGSVLRPF